MNPLYLTVYYEDVQPLANASFAITFRANIEARSVDDWTIKSLEVPTGELGDGGVWSTWTELTGRGQPCASAVRVLCWDYLTSPAGYDEVEARIAEEMRIERGLAPYDAADRAWDERHDLGFRVAAE